MQHKKVVKILKLVLNPATLAHSFDEKIVQNGEHQQ
jgi:hypothetical protein